MKNYLKQDVEAAQKWADLQLLAPDEVERTIDSFSFSDAALEFINNEECPEAAMTYQEFSNVILNHTDLFYDEKRKGYFYK